MDGTQTNGRKGLPYDWQALLAEHTARQALEAALAETHVEAKTLVEAVA